VSSPFVDPGPLDHEQPVPPSVGLLAQCPLVSQCWPLPQPAHIAPPVPHWLIDWFA